MQIFIIDHYVLIYFSCSLKFFLCQKTKKKLIFVSSFLMEIVVSLSVAQVSLARKAVLDELVQKRCREALELMRSAWQRSDSIHRGRCHREPWC